MTPETAFAVIFVALIVGGALDGQWRFAAVPVLVWPIVYLGMVEGWWLAGVGDGWEYGAFAVTAASVAATLLGIAAGRWLRARS